MRKSTCTVAGVFLATAAHAVAAQLTLTIVERGSGSSTVWALPGAAVAYDVIGSLDQAVDNDGLALWGAAVDFLGDADVANNEGLAAPSGGSMDAFVIPDGATNPVGYGGTIMGNSLRQVGGGQNTINNNANVAPYPIGAIVTAVAEFGPQVLAEGTYRPPVDAEGETHVISLGNCFANTIDAGGLGPVYAVSNAPADCSASLTIVVICPDGAIAFGSEHCPLGDAVIGTNGLGQLVLSNVGVTGLDGVELRLPDPPPNLTAAVLELGPPEANTSGAFIELGAEGTVSGVPDSEIVSVRLTTEAVNTSGFDSEVTITPDFSPIGASTYNVAVTSNGLLVAHELGVQGAVFISDDSLGRRDQTPPVLRTSRVGVGISASPTSFLLRSAEVDVSHTLAWENHVEILLPGVPSPVIGDTIIFSAGDGSTEIETLSIADLTAAGISSITITNEQVNPTPGDCDVDGDVDLADYSEFEACLLGPGGGLAAPECDCFDFDGNTDVDLRDFGDFERAFTG